MKPADAYLLAALDLLHFGHETFGLPDITVAVWKRLPETFGIPGYRHYPDKHRVASDLARWNRGGPLASGLLMKVARGRYKLTAEGRELAEYLAKKHPTEAA